MMMMMMMRYIYSRFSMYSLKPVYNIWANNKVYVYIRITTAMYFYLILTNNTRNYLKFPFNYVDLIINFFL